MHLNPLDLYIGVICTKHMYLNRFTQKDAHNDL